MAEEQKKQNWFLRHKFLTAILVIIILMAVGGGNDSSKPTSSGTNSDVKQAEVTTNFKMNEVAQNGDLTFTVTKVTETKSLGNSYTKKDAQGVFKVITVKVENKGKETKIIDSSMLKLKDAQDRTFERSVDGQTANGLSQGHVDLFLQQVQPSLSVTGEIVFDIPADATGLVLLAKDSMFGKAIEIKLE